MEMITYTLKSKPESVLVPKDAAETANYLMSLVKTPPLLALEHYAGKYPCVDETDFIYGIVALDHSPESHLCQDNLFLCICQHLCDNYEGSDQEEARDLGQGLWNFVQDLQKEVYTGGFLPV